MRNGFPYCEPGSRACRRGVELCGSLQAPMPAPYSIRTRRLVLDEFGDDDVEPLNAIRRDEETLRYLPPRPPESLLVTRSLVRTIRANNAEGRAVNLAVREVETGTLLGFAGMWRIDAAAKQGELGYMIARAHWNRGYATEALAALFELIDREHPELRLVGMVHVDNEASIRLLQRFEFTRVPRAGDEDPDCVRYTRGRAADR